MFTILCAYFIIALTFVVGKAALVYSQPMFLIGIRMILGGGLLLAYVYFKDRDCFSLARKDYLLFAQLIFFHIFLSFNLEFWSINYVTASKAAFMYNLSPFITALGAYLFLRETLTSRKLVGLVIGFLGSLPFLLAETPAAERAAGRFFFLTLPEAALLISAISSAYGWIILKKLVVNKKYSPIFANGIAMFFGGILSLANSILFEQKPLLKFVSSQSNSTIANQLMGCKWFCCSWQNLFVFFSYVLILILIANIVFYNLYGFLLKKFTPTFLSLVGLITPLFTALLGWIFLGERVGLPFFVSVTLVLLGSYIFYKDELQEQGLYEYDCNCSCTSGSSFEEE